MAMRGRPISATTIRHIRRLRASLPVRKVARETGVSPTTVVKYSKAG